MRIFVALCAVVTVMSLAYWAYLENYRTKAALAEVAELKAQIAEATARRNALAAEWAYLNRPERLERLVALNADLLGLGPLEARNFRPVALVPHRRPAGLEGLSDPVDLVGELPGAPPSPAAPAAPLMRRAPDATLAPAAPLSPRLPGLSGEAAR